MFVTLPFVVVIVLLAVAACGPSEPVEPVQEEKKVERLFAPPAGGAKAKQPIGQRVLCDNNPEFLLCKDGE